MAVRLPWPAARDDYDRACLLGECRHGVAGGDVIRPWCGSPGCPFCRRHPAGWRTVSDVLWRPARASRAPDQGLWPPVDSR